VDNSCKSREEGRGLRIEDRGQVIRVKRLLFVIGGQIAV